VDYQRPILFVGEIMSIWKIDCTIRGSMLIEADTAEQAEDKFFGDDKNLETLIDYYHLNDIVTDITLVE